MNAERCKEVYPRTLTLSFAADPFKLDQPDQTFRLGRAAKMKRYDSESQPAKAWLLNSLG